MIGCNYLNDFNGLKFHISGSASKSTSINILELTHKFIKFLIIKILNQNGHLIITFGSEPKKEGHSLIFDYTILEAIEDFYNKNPGNAKSTVTAILYSSYKEKMPIERKPLFASLKKFSSFQIKNLPDLSSHGGNLRNEISKYTDVLIALGGSIGVHDLIKKCNQNRKIVIPLNINLEKPGAHRCIDMLNNGSLQLYPSSISDYIISEINKFSLTSNSDLHDSVNNILTLTYRLMNERGEDIISWIIRDIKSLQEKNRALQPNEDKYSIILVEFLRRNLKNFGYFAHSQEISGKTLKGYNDRESHGGMGELDIRIVDENNELRHICEAFILTYLNTSYITKHLNKIFDYDVNGLPINIIIVYSKALEFSSLWLKYLEFLNIFKWKYPLIDSNIEDLSESRDCPSEIKLTLTKHNRSGVICKIYHIFVNLK